VGGHFAFVSIGSVLHTLNDFGFKGVAFLEEFANAFGIRAFNVGESLQVAGLASGNAS